MMQPERGFLPLFRNRPFLFLWAAQALALTAANGIQFVQIVLIEKLTRSSVQIALVIMAFSLPAVFFSPVAGVLVDRFPKTWIMVATNALRTTIALGYIFVLILFPGGAYLLLAIYFLTFLMSATGQFFVPAEAATIPFLVGGDRLLAANALFNLTLIATQLAGLIIVAPLLVKILGVTNAFLAVALMYLLSTVFVAFIPRDNPNPPKNSQATAMRRAWEEIQEGWRFLTSHPPISLAVVQSSMVITLIMIMALLAPGFATRVLHMAPEDAIVVFAPAGIGVFVATVLVGRFGHLTSRQVLTNGGLSALGLTLLALTWVAGQPDSSFFPKVSLISALSFLLGSEMAIINIPAQTLLQERSPKEMRGRILALYFMVANLVGIPPMLTVGAAADRFGILPVMAFVALVVILLSAMSIWRTWAHREPIREE